jgi:hypothetical protein
MTPRSPQRRLTARRFPVIFPRPGCLPGSPPLFRRPMLVPAHLRDLTDRARGYVEAASSANTRRAYASTGSILPPGAGARIFPPPPESGSRWSVHHSLCLRGGRARSGKPNSVSTIERRLAAIGWNCTQRGMTLDRKDRAIATVMAGIRNTHATPPSAERKRYCRKT